jgi:hypothetical protein
LKREETSREAGTGMTHFATGRHITSGGLCPSIKIIGDKLMNYKIKRVANRAVRVLKLAAAALCSCVQVGVANLYDAHLEAVRE